LKCLRNAVPFKCLFFVNLLYTTKELNFIFFFSMLLEFKMIGAGLATIALAGVGNGIGIIWNALLTSMSRNPSITPQLFNNAIFGFALVEAIALFVLMIVFLLMF
jgi:F-type H+-transporting ATPase subunit c